MSKDIRHKVRRELLRIAKQVAGAPSRLIAYFFARPFYDFALARRRKTSEGALPCGKRIAIFVIYPKHGLLASHLRSINSFSQAGYAPLVVSNLPLSSADQAQVLAHCWRYIERPNFGYDFGGYRDGILSIKDKLPTLERMILSNDSVWFPIPGAMDWVREAEALGVDYAGAVWSCGVQKREPGDYARVEWIVDKDERDFHYASYALSLSDKLLRSPDFVRFWSHFRLSNDKNLTVRRGEIGLTRWVMNKGFSHGATTELLQLDQILKEKSEAELLHMIEHLIYVTDEKMRKKVRLFLERARSKNNFPRANTEKVLLTAVVRQGASYSIMEELIAHHRFAFLKKSPAYQSADLNAGFHAALAHTPPDFRDEVMREIKASGNV